MNRIFSIVIDVVSALIIVLPGLIVLYCTCLKPLSVKKKAMMFVFSCYILAVFSVVGMPYVTGLTVEFSINILPFAGMISGPIESLLNVILFVPMGFLLPAIWEEFRSAKKTVLFGFLISLGIEILQIFTFRLTDINDLITNTAGTLLGYLLAISIGKKLFCNDKSSTKREVFLIFALTFLSMFFIAPLFSGIFWEIRYS